jgi:hypothetical protein
LVASSALDDPAWSPEMTWLLFNSAKGKKYGVGFMKVKDPDNLKQVLIQLGRLNK